MTTPSQPIWLRGQFGTWQGTHLICTLCPFQCRLQEGESGHCQVRRCQDHHMQTATLATSICHWQTIERKPFYHFRPASPTLTLASPGCTFQCDFCLNARFSQYGRLAETEWHGQATDPRHLVQLAAERHASIVFSYSEPTLAIELSLAIGETAAAAHVPILWKSNGFISSHALTAIAPFLSAVNIDLKTLCPEKHYHLTGAPLEPVLAGLTTWARLGVWLEVSTPLIPGINCAPADIQAMANFIHQHLGASTPWHLLRFHPSHRRHQTPATPLEVLANSHAIARHAGLHHVYVIHGQTPAMRTTFCPHCQYPVIQRETSGHPQVQLIQGRCCLCQHLLDGIWS